MKKNLFTITALAATDIKNLEDADVFIYNGAGMEHWTEDVLNSLENKDLTVVEASKDLTLLEGKEEEEDEDESGDSESEEVTYDPHVWLSPDSEPDASRMDEIIKFAKENDVKTIFFEELVSPKVSENIADEIGAKTAVLNPIEGLTDDEISAGEDYFSVMESNLKTLEEALNE